MRRPSQCRIFDVPNDDTRTLDGARYVLVERHKRLSCVGPLIPGTRVVCLRPDSCGYYIPCSARVRGVTPRGRVAVDLDGQRITVSLKAVLWFSGDGTEDTHTRIGASGGPEANASPNNY